MVIRICGRDLEQPLWTISPFQVGPLFSLWAHNCDMCSSNMPLPSGHIGQPQISTAIQLAQTLVACVHIFLPHCCTGESSQRLLPLDIGCYIWSMLLEYKRDWLFSLHTHTPSDIHTIVATRWPQSFNLRSFFIMILIQKLACEPNLSIVSFLPEWALMKTCNSFRVNVHTFVFHIFTTSSICL